MIISAHAKTTKEFLKEADETLFRETENEQRAEWVQNNFITDDTTRLTADANARLTEISTRFAKESKKYKGATAEEKRKLYLLLNNLVLPAPKDKKQNEEMTRLQSELESNYGSAKYCVDGKCRELGELEDTLKDSRKPSELLDAWKGWHDNFKTSKQKYQRVVELGNQGARDLGFKDLADVWKSKYDMSTTDYEKNIDRLWTEVKPLYEQLYCYVG